MKTYRFQWILPLMLCTSAYAKPPANDRGDRRPPPPMGPPLFAVIDTNRDGELSEDEVKAAADVIAKLDQNKDGIITLEELRMPPPPNDDNGPKDPPRGEKRPVPPLIAALDSDHDGTISAQEIESSPESLKTLDKNNDGELSPDELRPNGPPPPRDGEKGPDNGPPVE